MVRGACKQLPGGKQAVRGWSAWGSCRGTGAGDTFLNAYMSIILAFYKVSLLKSTAFIILKTKGKRINVRRRSVEKINTILIAMKLFNLRSRKKIVYILLLKVKAIFNSKHSFPGMKKGKASFVY